MYYKIYIVIGQPTLQQNVDVKILRAADTGNYSKLHRALNSYITEKPIGRPKKIPVP